MTAAVLLGSGQKPTLPELTEASSHGGGTPLRSCCNMRDACILFMVTLVCFPLCGCIPLFAIKALKDDHVDACCEESSWLRCGVWYDTLSVVTFREVQCERFLYL